jgi:hypothetical protein
LAATLLAYRYLLMYGYHAEAKIGCRLVNKEIKSHAWVCLDGLSFIDRQGTCDGFVPILSFPEAMGCERATNDGTANKIQNLC